MSNVLEVLDFDTVVQQEVKMGGRTFYLQPQSASIIQRVLALSQRDVDRETVMQEEDDAAAYIARLFDNWSTDVFEAVTLMLGLDPATPAGQMMLPIFEECLNPARVRDLFAAWWRINEVSDFFARGGRALMPEETLERARTFRERTEAALVAQAVELLREDEGAAAAPSTVN